MNKKEKIIDLMMQDKRQGFVMENWVVGNRFEMKLGFNNGLGLTLD